LLFNLKFKFNLFFINISSFIVHLFICISLFINNVKNDFKIIEKKLKTIYRLKKQYIFATSLNGWFSVCL